MKKEKTQMLRIYKDKLINKYLEKTRKQRNGKIKNTKKRHDIEKEEQVRGGENPTEDSPRSVKGTRCPKELCNQSIRGYRHGRKSTGVKTHIWAANLNSLVTSGQTFLYFRKPFLRNQGLKP